MRNWEILIYEKIDKMMHGDDSEVSDITSEIMNAYRFEFIDTVTKDYMLDMLQERKQYIRKFKDLAHRQAMYDIQLNQQKILEKRHVSELLKKADDEWRAENVRLGRPRTTTISLGLTDK